MPGQVLGDVGQPAFVERLPAGPVERRPHGLEAAARAAGLARRAVHRDDDDAVGCQPAAIALEHRARRVGEEQHLVEHDRGVALARDGRKILERTADQARPGGIEPAFSQTRVVQGRLGDVDADIAGRLRAIEMARQHALPAADVEQGAGRHGVAQVRGDHAVARRLLQPLEVGPAPRLVFDLPAIRHAAPSFVAPVP